MAFKLNSDSGRHFRRQQKAKFLCTALIQSPSTYQRQPNWIVQSLSLFFSFPAASKGNVKNKFDKRESFSTGSLIYSSYTDADRLQNCV
jgi:hypothetical protein